MAFKIAPIITANKLLYVVKVMHETMIKRPPSTLAEAKLLLDTFEVITGEAVREAESDLAPEMA